ncbi:MAG TPA: HNH endonuclease signature motif containing protein [Gemmataceae bacterium]|nr:HNH endonuclease signature motif containing protein [Gemmataceae bacterium]
MDQALADFVRERAGDCCEYCRLPQAVSSTRFQIDHIIAEQHGGRTVASNLALACLADNNHKGPNLAGVDPRSGKKVWLFNPRRHRWGRHFRWQGPVLVGRTPMGRATIAVLGINLPHRIDQRAALIAESAFPPTDL